MDSNRHGDRHSMDSNRHGDRIMNIIFMFTTLRNKSRGVPTNNWRISQIQDAIATPDQLSCSCRYLLS